MPKSQVSPLCSAMPCGSLTGSQGVLFLNPEQVTLLFRVTVYSNHHGYECSAYHPVSGRLSGAPGSAQVAVLRPAAGCMLVELRHHGTLSPVMIFMQRLLKPFMILPQNISTNVELFSEWHLDPLTRFLSCLGFLEFFKLCKASNFA